MEIKNGQLKMYDISERYKNYLRKFDSRVSEKESRKFVYFHSLVMTGLSFIFSSVELLIVSLLLPIVKERIEAFIVNCQSKNTTQVSYKIYGYPFTIPR